MSPHRFRHLLTSLNISQHLSTSLNISQHLSTCMQPKIDVFTAHMFEYYCSCRPPPNRNLQVWAAVQDDVTTGQRQHQAALKGKARKGTDQRSGKVQQKRSSLAPGDDAYGYCKQPVAPASRFCSSCGKPYKGKPQSQPASVEEWYRGPFHLKQPPATVSREWKVQKLARSEYLYVLTAGTLANNDPCKIGFKVKVLAIPDSTYEGVELLWWTVLVEVVNMRVSQAIKSGTKFALVQTDSQVDLERLKKVWDGKAKAKNKVFVEHLSVNDLLGYWRVDKKEKKKAMRVVIVEYFQREGRVGCPRLTGASWEKVLKKGKEYYISVC
eukprot:g80812.t1